MSDTTENTMLAQFKELSAQEQATFLAQAAAVHAKAIAAALKGAAQRKKLTPEEREAAKAAKAAKPKREQHPATKAWLDYVQSVHAEMKAADPSAKYGQAMQEASRRREAGDAAAPPKAEKPAKKPKAPKAEAEAEAKKPAAKKVASKPASAPAPAPAPAPAAKPAAKKAAVPAQPVVEAEAAEGDEETLQVFKHKGKTYLRSSQNECWLQGPDNTMGAWQGIFNPVKNAIVPAPEPEY